MWCYSPVTQLRYFILVMFLGSDIETEYRKHIIFSFKKPLILRYLVFQVLPRRHSGFRRLFD
jgi:hypothetical protein